MVRTQPTTENLSFSSCLYVKASRPDQVKGLFAYILQSGQHGIIKKNSTFCEVLFKGDAMKSFHAKTDNERFTAAISRCGQNRTSIWISRGRLVEYSNILHQTACRTCCTTVFPHSTNHIIDLWRCFCHLKHCVTSYMHWLCVASRTSLAYFPLVIRSRRRQVLLHMWSANTFSLLNQTVIMAENRGRRKVLIAVDGSEHGDRAFDCKLMIYICRKTCNWWQLFQFKFPRALFTFHARISVRYSKNRPSSQRESTVVGSLTEKKIFTDRAVGSSISCLWTQTCRTCRKQTPRDCKLNISWSLRSHKKAKRK